MTSAIFFVKDRVDKKEVSIKYCLTEKMLEDYFTKPLNGNRFRVLRGIIMGHNEINEIEQLALEERVENTMKVNENITSAS